MITMRMVIAAKNSKCAETKRGSIDKIPMNRNDSFRMIRRVYLLRNIWCGLIGADIMRLSSSVVRTAAGPSPKYPLTTDEALRTAVAANTMFESIVSSSSRLKLESIGANETKLEITELTKKIPTMVTP
jgi:hypothetical protein